MDPSADELLEDRDTCEHAGGLVFETFAFHRDEPVVAGVLERLQAGGPPLTSLRRSDGEDCSGKSLSLWARVLSQG